MPLTWRVHPYARRPARGRVALVVVVLLGAALAWSTGSAVFGLFSVAVLVASTFSYFVPTDYTAGPDALLVERLGARTRHPWSRFRSLERRGRRMWLSPFAEGSWAARLRSTRVDLPDSADEVCEYVRSRIGARP